MHYLEQAMSGRRRKKKRISNTSKKQKQPTSTQPITAKIMSWSGWLASMGVLAVSANFIMDFAKEDIEVEFIREVDRGYELKLVNKRPTDQKIDYFRVAPDLNQKPVFEVHKSVFGSISKEGLTIPGGNESYVPAFEYSEMNGYVIPARSDVKFKIPPLVSKYYLRPTAMVVYAEYRTRPESRFIHWVEDMLNLTNNPVRKKFLVSENYWTPLAGNSSINALRVACRDTEWFSKTSQCQQLTAPTTRVPTATVPTTTVPSTTLPSTTISNDDWKNTN